MMTLKYWIRAQNVITFHRLFLSELADTIPARLSSSHSFIEMLFIPSHSRFPFSVLWPPKVSANQIIKPEKRKCTDLDTLILKMKI